MRHIQVSLDVSLWFVEVIAACDRGRHELSGARYRMLYWKHFGRDRFIKLVFILIFLQQVLHHTSPGIGYVIGRCARRSRWNWKNRNNKGYGKMPRQVRCCFQLFRSNGLSRPWANIQRFVSSTSWRPSSLLYVLLHLRRLKSYESNDTRLQ